MMREMNTVVSDGKRIRKRDRRRGENKGEEEDGD